VAIEKLTLLTGKIKAIDDCGDDWLILEYTTYVRERTGPACATDWAKQESTFVAEGHHATRVSEWEYCLTSLGRTLVCFEPAVPAQGFH
jgi:hypothetical protein